MLGVQLDLAFNCVKGSGHCHNLLIIWGRGSPEFLCLEPVVLALGGGHESLVGDGCELAIEVILVLMVDLSLEVVAEDLMVSLKKDANGVINGCAPGNQI